MRDFEKSLSQDDLKEMTLETNDTKVTCNIRGKQYRFSEIDLGRIRLKH